VTAKPRVAMSGSKSFCMGHRPAKSASVAKRVA
jgi:hypothetical protein